MTFDFATDEVLLDIETICKKLSISRTTFERLRKTATRPSNLAMTSIYFGDGSDDYSSMPAFPEPTIVLGRSPRWSATALNTWLKAGQRRTAPAGSTGQGGA